MGLNIIQQPNLYASGFNPLAFILESTDTGEPNFRYTAEVSVNGIGVATLKIYPHPEDDNGYFDFSRIVSTALSLSEPNIDEQAFRNAPNNYANYSINFGAEWGSPPVPDELSTAFFEGYVINSAFGVREYNTIGFDVASYFANGSAGFKIMSNYPTEFRANAEDYGWIYFANELNPTATADAVRVVFEIKDGSTYNIVRDFYLLNNPNINQHIGGNDNPYIVQILPFLPASAVEIGSDYISDSEPFTTEFNITSNNFRYSYQFYDEQGGSPISDVYYIYASPCNSIYGRAQVFWQNRKGGIDSFVFDKPKRSTYNYNKLQAAKPLTRRYGNENSLYNSRGYSDFIADVEKTEAVNLISDNLTNEQFIYLTDLFSSPRVFIYDEDLGDLTPIIITDTNYSPKKGLYDGVNNLTINFVYPYKEFTQR